MDIKDALERVDELLNDLSDSGRMDVQELRDLLADTARIFRDELEYATDDEEDER